jgi:SAM-dependent methyltransferase
VGIDLDPLRVREAKRAIARKKGYPNSIYFVADGNYLPFDDNVFSLSIAILTLQHLAAPETALAEMKRVVKSDGFLVCIEADNLSQKVYLPYPQPELDDVLQTFWREIYKRYLPRNIGIGPYLAGFYKEAGLKNIEIDGYLISNSSWSDPKVFFERLMVRFDMLAKRYEIAESRICIDLRRTLRRVEEEFRDWPGIHSMHTVPVFLAKGRV